MNIKEVINQEHLARKAIVYIRQSSPHQVLTNQESKMLQYALKERALNLGWQPDKIEIIDSDLGLSGASATQREGFKEIASQVALGEVGIILSYEVDRLSRNCSDWYPLLDICGFRKCLIGDRENIYDPSTPNGRLLLGIKGQLSEMELYTIKARLTAGIINKATRGELALKLPVGYLRIENNQVVKDPNKEVTDRIMLIFDSFLRLKSASKVLRFFNDHNLKIPRKDQYDEIVWKKPSVSAILSTLKNPAYAGTFVYGRSQACKKDLSSRKAAQKLLPMEQWKIKVHDKYPSYIDWQTFEKIQIMLKDNYAEYDRNKSRGVPRPGSALLHGIVYCGECSHKMLVQYKTGTRYLCNHLRQQYGVAVCQYIPADPIDSYVVEAFFQALSPIELDVLAQTLSSQKTKEEQVRSALRQQVERFRYEANLSERQFRKVDPDNRLVAAELERRWENALSSLKKAEEEYNHALQSEETPLHLPTELKDAFKCIAKNLPHLWKSDLLKPQVKKALLRCLIDKVVIHRLTRDCVETRIVWKGGDTTTLKVPINVGSFQELSAAKEIEKYILQLTAEGKTDEEIAIYLTHLGYKSPMAKHVLPSTVQIIRLKKGILRETSQAHPRRIKNYLTVPQMAKQLDVPNHWLYDRIHKGIIQVKKNYQTRLYLFPDKPETIKQLKMLKEGKLDNLDYSGGYQDE